MTRGELSQLLANKVSRDGDGVGKRRLTMPWFINETRNDPIFVRLSTLHYYDCLKLIEIDTATASYSLVNRSLLAMSTRKADLHLPARTPTFVSREVGAAELCISPDTWDRMVDRKELPPAVVVSGMPRWKWEAVEAWLSGKRDCATMPENPYLAALADGKTQKHRNDRAT